MTSSTRTTLDEYLTECSAVNALSDPRFATTEARDACRLMLAIIRTSSRRQLARAPRPTEDVAIGIALNAIEQGWDVDEHTVYRAWAIARSKLTLDQVRQVAGGHVACPVAR